MIPALTAAAVALFAAAAVTDTLRRRIPNLLCAGLALLGIVRIVGTLADGTGTGLQTAADLAAALAVFAAGALAFRFGLLGGGDAKLLAAGTLWLGAASLGPFLLTTVLAGGILAVGFVIAQVARRAATADRAAFSLPYGIAIAAGGILTSTGALWT
jgi:prepilin peptidase CpaA